MITPRAIFDGRAQRAQTWPYVAFSPVLKLVLKLVLSVAPLTGTVALAQQTESPMRSADSTVQAGTLGDASNYDDPLLTPPTRPKRVLRSWDEALKLAQHRTNAIAQAVYGLVVTEGQARTALAAVLPTFGVNANLNQVGLRTEVQPLTGGAQDRFFPDNSLSYGASAGINWQLVNFRNWYGIRVADTRKDVAAMGVQEQKRLLIAALASALVAVVAAERSAEISRVALLGALERLRLVEQRVGLGRGTTLDKARARGDVQAARTAVNNVHEQLAQSWENLGLALGLPEPIALSPGFSVTALVGQARQLCVTQRDINERTDVRAAQLQRKVQREQVKYEQLDYWPSLALVTNYSTSVVPFANTIISSTISQNAWSIGATLTWNVFDGGARYGRIKVAKGQLAQSEANLSDAQRKAQIQTLRTVRGIGVSLQALEIASKALAAAREVQRLSLLNYRLGQGTTLDLVLTARDLRQAEVAHAAREVDVVQAKIQALIALSVCNF